MDATAAKKERNVIQNVETVTKSCHCHQIIVFNVNFDVILLFNPKTETIVNESHLSFIQAAT